MQSYTMDFRIRLIILLSFGIKLCICIQNAYYTAAVVEYHPVEKHIYTPDRRTIENAKRYIDLLISIDQAVDIAVFPEDTLTHGIFSNDRKGILNISPIIGKLDGSIIPCKVSDDYPQYFVDLSCAARQLKTYLVVNIVEKAVCSTDTLSDTTKCAADNWSLYNANVVFDRKGAIVARYRKFHLFREFAMNVTEQVELSTFTTDFGVTFGIFTCFDIMFEEPSLLLVRQNVKHFVFPSMWFSQSPFLTAMQTQNMWAVANDVALLAAGANEPFVGSGGSGIYLGNKGPLKMGVVAKGGSKTFVHKIPKSSESTTIEETNKVRDNVEIDKLGANMDSFHLSVDQTSDYNTYPINDNIDTNYCHGDFCCHFKVSFSKNATTSNIFYKYKAVVYSGLRKYDSTKNMCTQVCAIIFCKDDTVHSCGRRIFPYNSIEWGTRFDEIIITGTYDNVEKNVQYPSTLLSDIRPLASDSYKWKSTTVNGNMLVERTIRLTKPQDRLMSFGIFGRDFSRDDKKEFVDRFGVNSNTL